VITQRARMQQRPSSATASDSPARLLTLVSTRAGGRPGAAVREYGAAEKLGLVAAAVRYRRGRTKTRT
jgi:hypothetical protein